MPLWNEAVGVGVSPDDTQMNISNYLARNPKTSFVAVEKEEIAGAIMAGHDGYRGFIHHTAMAAQYRNQGIGERLVTASLEAIKDDGVNKVVLVVFKTNQMGSAFWEKQGFRIRNDLHYRDLRINS